MPRSKYRAVKTVVDGIRFDSKLEARRWRELVLLQEAGAISLLQRQAKWPIWWDSHLICTYVADFTYRRTNGEYVVEDAKGMRTATYNLKKKLMLAAYGISIQEWPARPKRGKR